MKYSKFNNTPYEGHWLVVKKIIPSSLVLDVGCASGYFAKELLKKKCKIWGIDNDILALGIAKKYCIQVSRYDLNNITNLLPERRRFDYILLLDVLEHIYNPKNLLLHLRQYLKNSGKIIISIPNIAFISIRLSLLNGKFKYTKYGIMDEDHVHFYTLETCNKLLTDCGFHIDEVDVSAGFSQITAIGGFLNNIPHHWQYRITKLFPKLLAYQFIFTIS